MATTGWIHLLREAVLTRKHLIPVVLLVIGIVLNAPVTVVLSVVILLGSVISRFYMARKASMAVD